MRPDERDAAYLWDIVDSCRLAVDATRDLDFAAYEANRLVQAAVERWVEVIGEAARRLSEEYRLSRPDVPWAKIVAQRNVLAHEYRDIQHERLWELIQVQLPRLAAALEPDLPAPPLRID